MHCRKAIVSDITAVRKLWEEVFGDSGDYIRRFITHFGIENCFVSEANSKIVAMAFAIPTNLKSSSIFEGAPEGRGSLSQKFNVQRLKYLYACATYHDFQGQGIMKNLLNAIYEDACIENVAGIFLQAANQSLAEYYQNVGFEAFFFREHSFYYKDNFNQEPIKLPHLGHTTHRISHTAYHQKRVQKLKNHCFINWSEGFFRFLNETGTQFCKYEHTIFSFKTSLNNIIVDELLGDAPHEQIAQILFKEFPDYDVVHIRSYHTLHTVYCSPHTIHRIPHCCGQMKWCNIPENKPEKGWLGFAME